MLERVHFDEAKQSQLPLVELLINMGYKYVSRDEALRQRGGDTTKFILADIAREALMRINSYEDNGQTYKFSDVTIAQVVEELEATRLEGLMDTSQKIYNIIMPKTGGMTKEVLVNGRRESKDIRFIDFEHPENNEFHVTVEYTATGKESIRCDVVCFVNGLPFVVIENKKSSVDIEQAIIQLLGYQKPEKCPRLFIYPQLLIATNGSEFLYGTTGTPAKFYVNWREKEIPAEELDARIHELIAKPINKNVYAQLLADLNGSTTGHAQKLSRRIKEQDRGAFAMLQKHRLLDIAKNFILYDAGTKKVMRYQQYFAIHKMLRRVHEIEQTETGERRRGGIVWHTQGSGKSLTMVMFVRALIEDPEIKNPRVLVVTDRRDLDRQIKATFQNAGLKKEVKQAASGEDLLDRIRDKDDSIITTLVHKFGAASRKRGGFVDYDKNIFVLVDEAHRSHSGESPEAVVSASMEMQRTIPNACFIAFTGTPLLKKDKSRNRWGSFIDKYTIDDALNDNVILPLIYEGRYVDLRQDSEEIDRLANRVMEDLSAKQKYLVQKDIERRSLQENPRRIEEICYDIEKHYTERFQGTGLKAQIVAPSKYAALLMQRYFEKRGKIQTALVISDENGEPPEDDEHKKEVEEFLKYVKANYINLQKYEESVIDSFINNPDGIEILIVVDKLLTGFDAPPNTVLYLAKELRDHNLLQAIARVNRLYKNPNFPKTAGFIIDYSENAQNIHTAMQLFGNYDEEDVKHALIDVDDKIRELESAYDQLCDMFKGVDMDDQALLEYLRDEPTRKLFGEKVSNFQRIFTECLDLQNFAAKFNKIGQYKQDFKKFHNLKKSAALMYGDHVDLRKYKLELVKILDDNVKAAAAEVMTDEIEITDRDQLREAVEELGSTASKAEAIAAQTSRIITERREEDPKLYDRFSKRIDEIIEAMRQKKLADIEALKQLRLLSDEVLTKKDDTLPEDVAKKDGAGILYRNLEDELYLIHDKELYKQTILDLTDVVKRSATVDWWRNHEIKRAMRNNLDDYLYDVVKMQHGIDLDYKQIEVIIEKIMTLAENNHQTFTK